MPMLFRSWKGAWASELHRLEHLPRRVIRSDDNRDIRRVVSALKSFVTEIVTVVTSASNPDRVVCLATFRIRTRTASHANRSRLFQAQRISAGKTGFGWRRPLAHMTKSGAELISAAGRLGLSVL
jgi:hypothetical protein